MLSLHRQPDYVKMLIHSQAALVYELAGLIKSRIIRPGSLSTRSLSQNSAELVGDQPLLVRDFIYSALYHPKFGYFATRPEAVGILPEPLSFSSLEGRRAYMQHLDTVYKQNDISWFTPVEIFKPWYGYGIAEYIRRALNPAVPLQIYEIGGGAGTCAKNILDYIKLRAPTTIYKNMNYVSVEISKALAIKQTELVSEVTSHKKHFHVECRSANGRNGWGPVDMNPCFVIMLEVLDNQPHDLLYREDPSSPWMETHVFQKVKSHSSTRYSEIHKPVEDPIIKQCIDIIENSYCSNSVVHWYSVIKNWILRCMPLQQRVWIPTGCLQLLKVLHEMRPNMILIASDFSFLPDVKIEGERAPLVASKKGGITRDYATYLDVKGDADVFFPTDFHLLEKLDHHCSSVTDLAARRQLGKETNFNRRSSIVDSTQFLKNFADTSKTRTRDGYNPMLDDYSNTKFYLSSPIRLTSLFMK